MGFLRNSVIARDHPAPPSVLFNGALPVDDADLCWLALNLVFYGPSAGTRRLLARFAQVTDIFRAAPAEFDGLRLDPDSVEAIVSGRALDRARGELEKVE